MDEARATAGDTRATRREKWRRILEEQRASGQKAAAFCRGRGMPVWKFQYWRQALARDEVTGGGFVELHAKAEGARPASVWVDVGSWRVCVTPGFDTETLRRAVEALAAP